jgi:hypothetical protein
MSSESVCRVERSWVDVGIFHTRLFIIFIIFTESVRNILDIPYVGNVPEHKQSLFARKRHFGFKIVNVFEI